ASVFALSEYFKEAGKETKIVYSGVSPISKPNLRLMVAELGIQARYIPKNEAADASSRPGTLLLLADCQYGAGNVKRIEAAHIAVIDHHVPETPPTEFSDIRPFLGSCSTLVWLLLKSEGFRFDRHPRTSTALYYGLYTDTGGFSEIAHPHDRDMRDSLRFDKALIKKLKNCNLAIQDLALAGRCLLSGRMDVRTAGALFYADPCDPNLLGFISDLALQAEGVDSCAVFCEVNGGIKLSVRSCVREVMASDLAARLCAGGGSGGGHADKAGGYISLDFLVKSGYGATDFLQRRYAEYFERYDVFCAGAYRPDLSGFKRYVKRNIPVGYVRTVDVRPEGTDLTVRTLEGDSHIVSAADTYIMVGIQQEVYPISRDKFERSYAVLDGAYTPRPEFLTEAHYTPSIIDRACGTAEDIEKYIRPCVAHGETLIYAKPLLKDAKVLTKWNPEGYMSGEAGDLLAVRADDPDDIYLIKKEIFELTYTVLGD
ncbi:MAG: recombinase RecJ, partial [Firmicutes bacterium]|nr:recombinase RecJ [Bacillota bacterium]